MQRQETLKGPWPLHSCCLEMAMYKLVILEACRHHFEHLGGCFPEDSLCLLPSEGAHLFPGPFVQIQLAVALRTDNQELAQCRLKADGTGQFKVNGGQGVIEAEVKSTTCKALKETVAIDCCGNELPSCAGKFVFLLPASIPTAYHISIKFKAVAGELLHEIQLFILTHHQNTNLFDYVDGHSLSSVELPVLKKQLGGILGIPEGQKILSHFQELVENVAIGCFRRDQLCLIQHIQTSNHVEAKFQDLVLAVQSEECLLLYQIGDLEGCKRVGEDVCIQANRNHSTNYNALVGRAKSVVSGAYKMEKDFVKAEELLYSSIKLLQEVVSSVDTSINRTRFAALLSKKAAVVGITKSEIKKLKKALKVVLRNRHQFERNQSRIARSPRRALIRAILFYLCSTKDKATNLQTDVSHKDLTRAEEFAEQFMREFLPNCPMRDRAGFFNAYGDLLTRKGHYEEAIRLVSEALKMAEDLQLRIDIKGARDRLQQLNRLRMERSETERKHRDFAERRTEEYNGFQDPGCEVLQALLMQLERAMN